MGHVPNRVPLTSSHEAFDTADAEGALKHCTQIPEHSKPAGKEETYLAIEHGYQCRTLSQSVIAVRFQHSSAPITGQLSSVSNSHTHSGQCSAAQSQAA